MSEWNQKHVSMSILVVGVLMAASMFYLNIGLADIGKKLDETNSKLSGLTTSAPQQAAPSPSPSPSPLQQPQPQAKQDVKLGSNVLKGKNAKIEVVEFSDFECPFCQRAFPTVQQVLKDYGDKISLSYRHYPLPFHPNAKPAAIASECAAEQGKFWEYHDKLFEAQVLDAASLKKYAKELGLDTTKFNSCLDSSATSQKVDDDTSYGQSVGVSGTPTFFINGVQLVGAQPYTAFKQLLDQQLAG